MTLQLHTAHILSAHASLQEKSKTIQDVREQKNKYVECQRHSVSKPDRFDRLESERTRLLNALREVSDLEALRFSSSLNKKIVD